MSRGAPTERGLWRSLAPILAFDVVGPLAAYYSLSSAGASTVLALVLSGVVPAFGIALGALGRRRVDAIGVVVLIGILAGTVLSLASGSAHLALLDGTLPTAVFGLVCLGSLASRRPLIFLFAVEAMGADTSRGRDFADRWRYPAFRHTFRVITTVWGLAFLAETGAQLAIIESASTATAKTASNVMPLAVAAAVVAWNVVYGQSARRKGERAAAAASARGEQVPPLPG